MTPVPATVTDRYVQAVLHSVPSEQRAEVEQGLRASIAAEIAERVAQGLNVVEAERAVLTEFGDPMRVGAARSGRVLALVGPAVFPAYVRLLRLLLVIVVPIITILSGLGSAIAGEEPVAVLTSAIGAGFSLGVQLTFWVTVVFAIIDRRGWAPESTWDVDDLPELPRYRIGLGETIASIVGLALLTWFIVWQPGYQFTLDSSLPAIPILNPSLGSFWTPYLVVVLLASIALEIVKFRVGRWTLPLASVNTLLNAAFAIPVFWLLTTGQVVNPEFVAAVTMDPVGALDVVPTLIAWIIAAFSAFDVVEGWWKALRGVGRTRG